VSLEKKSNLRNRRSKNDNNKIRMIEMAAKLMPSD